MSTKRGNSNETRSMASKRKMREIAKSRLESLQQSQSSDNSLSRDTYDSERSAPIDSTVVRTPKPSSSKRKKSKSQAPPSPIIASAQNDDDEYQQEEEQLSPTSEDRGSVDRLISKRARSPSEESFDRSSNISEVDENYIRTDRSFPDRSENRRSRLQHQNEQCLVPGFYHSVSNNHMLILID